MHDLPMGLWDARTSVAEVKRCIEHYLKESCAILLEACAVPGSHERCCSSLYVAALPDLPRLSISGSFFE